RRLMLSLFYVMTPPHQTSTLFPYTTLFRSQARRAPARREALLRVRGSRDVQVRLRRNGDAVPDGARKANGQRRARRDARAPGGRDRKSTRLNSSHGSISYAVFCLKKKEARDTNFGKEDITRDIPNVGEEAVREADESGITRMGAWGMPGDMLVVKLSAKGVRPLSQ